MERQIERGVTVGVISPCKPLVAVYLIEETNELIRTPIIAIAFEQNAEENADGAKEASCDIKPVEFDPNPLNPQFAYVPEREENASFLGYELEEAPLDLESWKKYQRMKNRWKIGRVLKKFHSSILGCQACSLHRNRTHLVFGRGSSQAKIMLVGEAPGREEDLEGRPFVGTAGKLLAQELAKAGLRDKDIFIANVLKCRPPGDRDPLPEEIEACLPYLKRQIEILHPRIICSLGKFATQVLLSTQQGITSLRGKPQLYEEDIIIIPTLHPAACIYNPSWRNLLLRDLELVKRKLSG